MQSFLRLILLGVVILLVSFLTLISTNLIKIQQFSTGKKYRGINLLENYSVNYYLPDKINLINNVHYFFRYEYGYNLRESLSKIIQLGGNTVVFCPAMWMKERTSTEILFDKEYRQKLVDTIREAKFRGLKVILRPMLHILALEQGDDWRGTIEPQNQQGELDWASWFQHYKTTTDFYFQIALEGGADVYVTGVELLSSTDTGEIKHWGDLLDDLVKARNENKSSILFAYDALYVSELQRIHGAIMAENKDYIRFFSNLDHLGINFYPQLLNENEYGEYDRIVRRNIQIHGNTINTMIEEINYKVNSTSTKYKFTPAVIAEYGIKSAKGASVMPWIHPQDKDIVDYQEQARALEIGIQVLNKFENINGILIWNSYIDPFYGIENFTGREGKKNGENTFAITGKPAEKVIQKKFFEIANLSWVLIFSKLSYTAYVFSAFFIFVFGLHRLSLIFRARKPKLAPLNDAAFSPLVTIQVPVFNEPHVVKNLIKKLLELDYPADKFEIQVLDDSTDNTPQLIASALSEISTPISVHHIRRKNRFGYKAGALAEGLKTSKGEFIAIFDADFRPEKDFLRSLLPYFKDPKIGMVQAKWGFLNSAKALLTRVQSLFLNGHFYLDHTARFNSKCFFNFNGTAGIFRRSCIDDSGGWEADSLTEDLDLSYRAQMKGWQFIPLMSYLVPSELPEKILHYKKQQQRWVKGSIQVYKKLFFKVFATNMNFKQKLEAFFHLTGNSLYFFVLLLALGLLPTINARLIAHLKYGWLVDLPMLFGSTLVMFLFYLAANKNEGRARLKVIFDTLFAMLISIGMSVSNTIAFLEGLLGIPSAFERTPKKGDQNEYAGNVAARHSKLYAFSTDILVNTLEWLLVYHSYQTLMKALEFHMFLSMPFSMLFLAGFLYVALQSSIEIALRLVPN